MVIISRQQVSKAVVVLAAVAIAGLLPVASSSRLAWSQETPAPADPAAPAAEAQDDSEDEPAEVPSTIAVNPVADVDIAGRIQKILEATGYFVDPEVRVQDGVVFLSGQTREEKNQEFAERVAIKTEDVVAVVNQIEVLEPPLLDFSPAYQELGRLGRSFVRSLPLVIVAIVAITLSFLLGRLVTRSSRRALRRSMPNPLLRNVVSRAIGVLVLLLGIYLTLRVADLTRLAVTVLGGTGLLGLVIGFAFRDIAENFLASILISIQRPFATGDLIRVVGLEGFVQSVNTRSTLLMSIEGNILQIPNATIYKEVIINQTANNSTRIDFTVGIGYDVSIPDAQQVILGVLQKHEAVLTEPEPLVLVDSLGAATIQLKVLFWVNTRNHSKLKVKSAVIRLSTGELLRAGMTLPDEAREIVFPNDVPVRLIDDRRSNSFDENASSATPTAVSANPPGNANSLSPKAALDDTATATSAEGDLSSDDESIKRQAETTRKVEGDVNLI